MVKRLFLLLFCCTSVVSVSAAGDDSIALLLGKERTDTGKVNLLNRYSKTLQSQGDFNGSLKYAMRAYKLAGEVNYKDGLSRVTNNIGTIFWRLSLYDSSLTYLQKALKIREEIRDTSGIAGTLNNIGLVYSTIGDLEKVLVYYERSLHLAELVKNYESVANTQINIGLVQYARGNYPAALEYFFKSLRFYERAGDKEGLVNACNNIGSVYEVLEKPKEALEYLIRCAKLCEELGDINGTGVVFGNISGIYADNGEFSKALDYQQKGVELLQASGDRSGLAGALNNLGSIYFQKGQNDEALKYMKEALVIKEEAATKYGIANTLIMIAEVYERINDLKDAERYLTRGMRLAHEINAPEILKSAYMIRSSLLKKQGKGMEALEAYEKYISYRDSIYNKENSEKTLRASMNFEYEKKATADSVIHAEEQKVKDAEIIAQKARLKEEKVFRYALFAGLFVVAGFSTLLFNRFRTTRRQKKIIEAQKDLVEEKNREIVDSINYARRIQQAMLKEQEQVSSHLPEHFVLFKPKDIVSGDFYWSLEKGNYWFVAAADCTGHGVPGAFMSMLGISFLNEITNNENHLSPSEILDQLRARIISELGGKNGAESSLKDGMDISLARLDLQTGELTWSGANNPLWIYKAAENSIVEITADKQPIGYHPESKPFTDHSIQLSAGDIFYLFTDGYADQFGGGKGKKLKYKPFKQLLLENSSLTCNEQKQVLAEHFASWKRGFEQTDDVCLIAIRY